MKRIKILALIITVMAIAGGISLQMRGKNNQYPGVTFSFPRFPSIAWAQVPCPGASCPQALNITFTKIEASTNGVTYQTIIDTPSGVTVNLLNNTVQTTGASLGTGTLSAGTYKFMRIFIAKVSFITPSGSEQDFTPTLKFYGVNLSPALFASDSSVANAAPMFPFVIPEGGSTTVKLNFFVAPSSITVDAGTYGMSDPPVVSVKTSDPAAVSSADLGTLSGTISGLTASAPAKRIFVGVFQKSGDMGPAFGGEFTQNVSGTSTTYSFRLPPGTYFVGSFEDTDGSLGASGSGIVTGPNLNDKFGFFIGGTGPAPLTITAGGTATANFSLSSTFTFSGPGSEPGGITVSISVPSVTSLSGTTNVMAGAFTFPPGGSCSSQSGQPPVGVAMKTLLSGTNPTNQTITIKGLAAGTYCVGAFLDVNADGGPPGTGDLFGFLGGVPSPTSVTVTTTVVDQTVTAVQLNPF